MVWIFFLHLETSIKTSFQTLIETFNVTLILFPSVFIYLFTFPFPPLVFFLEQFF